jgi:hypothetical protein
MDVALDANAILNDPRMQGNAFHSLLDYLKKTNSRLVLSKVVLDEAIARYTDRLRPAIHKARAAVCTLDSLLLDARVELPKIDEKREARWLRKRLLKPSRQVKSSVILNNFPDVKMEEVARRGIERIPPANGKGEELRDVIHWLMVLAYARASKQEIAFITGDEHFRHETALHPRLKKDLEDNDVSLRFHVSIDEFIKAYAPAPRELTEGGAFEYYGKSHVMDRFEIEARKFFPARWPAASTFEIVRRDVRLMRGALYDVAPNSQFGELEFSGEVEVRVTTELPAITSEFTNFPLMANRPVTNLPLYGYPGAVSPVLPSYGYPNLVSPVQGFSAHYGEPATMFYSGQSLGLTLRADFAFKSIPNMPTSFVEDVSEFRATGRLVISLRIVSGKVKNIETESFQLGEIEKLSASAP